VLSTNYAAVERICAFILDFNGTAENSLVSNCSTVDVHDYGTKYNHKIKMRLKTELICVPRTLADSDMIPCT
jgi:hypothetical protein